MNRILFDARMSGMSGIGTYIRELLAAMETQWPATWMLERLPDEGMPPIYTLAEQWVVAKAFNQAHAALLHVPHYNVPVTCVTRSVVTVHDVIHLLFPQFLPSRLAWAYAQFFFRVVIPQARAVITVSEHTKRDLIRLTRIPPQRITVTPLGVSTSFSPDAAIRLPALRELWGLPETYLLYVGNLKAFKNVEQLVEAYGQLYRTTPGCPPLVMAGRNFIDGFEERLRGVPGIRRLTEVHREDLPALYAGALAFVYPSLYEGFGLPPLEAMACGTPVITSGRASLGEVVGEAALLVDPEDPQDIRKAMARVLSNAKLRQELRERGLRQASRFKWARTARQTLEVYQQCLA